MGFIDYVSTDFEIGRGHPLPLGATLVPGGVNFSVFSSSAKSVSLVLFKPQTDEKVVEFPLDPRYNRTGHVWHLSVRGMDTSLGYGYRVEGDDRLDSQLYRFNSDNVLIDPYARALGGGEVWGGKHRWTSQVVDNDAFDWEHDQPLNTHLADSIIYELHVRGFTCDPSSGVTHPGTYRGIIDKIPYLTSLGVTAVELLPVTEFDENDNPRLDPISGKPLKNFWGYHPLNFFSPKGAYAASVAEQVHEFKEMVKALHRAGIEVILDMVFNHTGEGNERGDTTSFRGFDNPVYYLVDEQTGDYANYSGCGNTLNCNHPVVRDLILDALCYWVTEMHVDGFRFDLASILGRGRRGEVLEEPPLLERITASPVLANTKLIAEAWDAAGLYQVGSFPNWGRWAEWNGRYRDDMRRFLRGDSGMTATLATRLCGSSDLYEQGGRAPFHSINFITSHDGFTLKDLFSYDRKHNENNGESNRDGDSNNHSTNCGVEGETTCEEVLSLRNRLRRNAFCLLLFSRGVPMLLAGDELGRSQRGNNNSYCQDNSLNWINWAPDTTDDLSGFVSTLIAFRKRHPALRSRYYDVISPDDGSVLLSWHDTELAPKDWESPSSTLGLFFKGQKNREKLYLMINGDNEERLFRLPPRAENRSWKRFVDTALEPHGGISTPGAETVLGNQDVYKVHSRSVVMLVCS